MTSPADVHAAKLATIEAAADAEESLRARVADEIAQHDYVIWDREANGYHLGCTCGEWESPIRTNTDKLRGARRRWELHRADAAIATICTPVEGAPAGCGAEAALQRVLRLADDYDRAASDAEQEGLAYAPTSDVREYHRRVAAAGHTAADRIRDAAGGTA